MKGFTISTIIIISIISLAYLSMFDSSESQYMVSETGCCSIKVRKVMGRDTYYVTYEDLETGESESYPTNKAELDQVINEYQEVCYHNH